MSFGNRLKQLRLENTMTQEDLSNILNVSRAAVGRYETNERFPDKNILNSIADTFDVSLDYLLGRSDSRNLNIFFRETPIEPYSIIDSEIRNKLIEEEVIQDGDLIPKTMVEDIIDYGVEAAIKIYLLKNKLEDQ